MYRVNQDGEKLFKIMLKAKEYLTKSPSWQYIVFSYNEHNIEKAKETLQKTWPYDDYVTLVKVDVRK